MQNDYLYGIDAQDQFWRYHVKSDEFNIITTTDKDINFVSDINSDQFLATKFIGGRRELVEFSREAKN